MKDATVNTSIRTYSLISGMGLNLLHAERRAGGSLAVVSASILSSQSNLIQDLSYLKTSLSSGRIHQVTDMSPSAPFCEDKFDIFEVSLAHVESVNAAYSAATSKILS